MGVEGTRVRGSFFWSPLLFLAQGLTFSEAIIRNLCYDFWNTIGRGRNSYREDLFWDPEVLFSFQYRGILCVGVLPKMAIIFQILGQRTRKGSKKGLFARTKNSIHVFVENPSHIKTHEEETHRTRVPAHAYPGTLLILLLVIVIQYWSCPVLWSRIPVPVLPTQPVTTKK